MHRCPLRIGKVSGGNFGHGGNSGRGELRKLIGGARMRGKCVRAFVGSNHAKMFSSFLNGGQRPVVIPVSEVTPTYLTLVE